MSIPPALPLPRHLLAADNSQPYSYPIPDGALIFRAVPLARLGRCFPHGAGPDGYEMDAQLFAGMAGNYDPLFFVATASVDHPGLDRPKAGPAEGLILNPVFDEEAGLLRADVIALDYWFGELLSRGQLPHRSIEWVDSRLAPEGHPRARFYGLYDFYLTHVAFMALVEPAVAGLGPLPAPEVFRREELAQPIPYLHPLAAQQARLCALSTTPHQEVAMSGLTATAAPGAAQAASVAAQNAPPDSTTLQAAATADPARLSALEQENEQLRASFARIEDERRAEKVDALWNERRLAGTASPAQEQAFKTAMRAALLLESAAHSGRLSASAEADKAALGGLRAALDALLDAQPKEPRGAAMGNDGRQPQELQAASNPTSVTSSDRLVAKALGITPEQAAANRVELGQAGASGNDDWEAQE